MGPLKAGCRHKADGTCLQAPWRSSVREFNAAEALCNQLYEAAPQDPAPHQLAATISLQRGRLEDAARWVHSCLALRADHPPALILAGSTPRLIDEWQFVP